MLVANVMSRPVLTIRADDTAEQATALLSHENVTAAPVIDDAGDLVGIVSEGDLLRARVATAHGEQAETRPAIVADVMTRNPVVLSPEADLSEAAEAMLRYKG